MGAKDTDECKLLSVFLMLDERFKGVSILISHSILLQKGHAHANGQCLKNQEL